MKKLLYLFFFWLIVSCEKEEATSQIYIDSDILIEVQEITVSSEKKVVLNCSTEKIYDCSNYYIDLAQEKSADSITVDFNGISPDEICAPALSPAQTKINLGSLINGFYPLTLKIKQVENNSLLTVTDSQIHLDFPQQDGIRILNPVYTR